MSGSPAADVLDAAVGFGKRQNVGETGAFLAIFVKVNFRSNYVRI